MIEQLPDNIKKFIKIVDNHWIWVGAVSDENRKHLQPRIRFDGKLCAVSRVVMHLLKDFNLNSELQINHKQECNLSLCVNPECLYEGTQQQNIDDIFRIPKLNCPQGHEMVTSPTTGHRYCQICKNKRRDEWRKKNK